MRTPKYLKPGLLVLLIAWCGLSARAQSGSDVSLVLNRAVVSGGDSVSAQIKLSSPAEQGIEFKLTVIPANAATLPREVVIEAGKKIVEFNLKTATTTADVTVKIKGEFSAKLAEKMGGTIDAGFKVAPGIIKSMTLSKTTLVVNSADSVTGTITLESAAPDGGLEIPLSISPDTNTNLVIHRVLIAGGQKTASFQIAGKPLHAQPNLGTVSLVATLGGTTATVQLTIQAFRIVSCQIAPASGRGPFQAVATVTLNAPLQFATNGGLVSNNVAVVNSALSSIAANADHFSVSLSAGTVTSSTTVTFTVRVDSNPYGAHKDNACTLTVLPAQ